LGGGGMGVVYKAEDTRLNRFVALKFLSDEFAHDPEALSRFRREARAASALNHPNICTIHDIGEQEGRSFIVMEYVEGATLKQRLAEGRLEVDTVLALGIAIADALDAAHTIGILHRDIKPGNIAITQGGRPKILDFGLAQLLSPVDAEETVTKPVTKQGTVLGTAGYMSPEQTLGEPLDERSDLFSFGLVLYEMATGKRLVGAVPLDGVAPPELRRIVSKCLQNDRELRYRHASEIRTDLNRLKQDMDSGRLATARSAKRRLPVVSLAAAMLALLVASYYIFHRAPKLTDKDTIVLADFKNSTGDPVFDGALRQGLAVQLRQSPFLSLVPDERIQKGLRLMGRSPDAPLTPEFARDICERTGSAAVLDGSIAKLGSQYVLGLRAKNCRTGDILDEEQAQAAKKEDVLNALSQIAGKFRTRVGESLATVEKHSTPLAEATTPSLEALKAYSAAEKVGFSDPAAAVPLLQRALQIDADFAMAHAFLGRVYGDVSESVLSAESTGKAYQLRERASDPERFFIMLSYDLEVTGNLEKVIQTGELWAQTYPRDFHPRGFLSWIYQLFAKYEKSSEEGQEAIRLDPDFTPGYNNLGWAYVFLDRLDEAGNTIKRASERKLDSPDLLIMRYYIAFLRDDKAGMERAAALGKKNSGAEDWITGEEAGVLGYSGHLAKARTMSRRAVDLGRHAGERERGALYEAAAAVREALFGNAPEARRGATAALELSKSRDVEYGAAFALAISGDSSRSQALTSDLEKRFREDTIVRFTDIPTLRALLALNHGEPSKAIELLQIAAPYDLAVPGSWAGFFGNLYPVYVRGEAYLAAHQGAEAAAEFQKILDHRAIVAMDPIGALAHLQLGRAFSLSGDKTKAKTAYQDFLNLWKDADPDIPILKQAQTEYARLR
ncbi:MAG: protein kinase domain-containing protein, partial [Bryobacteraceae bacterium]